MVGYPERFGDDLRRWIEGNLARFPCQALELGGRTPAAVAVTLLPDEEGRGCFLITRRAGALRRHRGQWALPGGRIDGPESAEEAALRELAEEVGLSVPARDVLGRLDDYATRSGFVITPVLVWADGDHELRPDPSEVAGAYRVPLVDLDRPDVPFLTDIPESDRPVLSMPVLGRRVFAPTAAIIYQLLEVALRGSTVRVVHYEQPVFAWR